MKLGNIDKSVKDQKTETGKIWYALGLNGQLVRYERNENNSVTKSFVHALDSAI